ncbi:hypothetical protein Taro_026900 [Colocasia esculenta]|uniref:Uncharacterized protein n=1 Tax=Colocasia esculenta TaxID=4460 RepID=A0A843VCL6_COLES|nr:hypothetical protein [Colocasia esculenta]
MVATARCIATTIETGYVLAKSVFCGVFTISASYCTRGTCASSLVRSYTSRSPGARHLLSGERLLPLPWTPVPTCQLREYSKQWGARVMDFGAEGKTMVRTVALSPLQRSRGWSGTPRSFGVLPGACQSVLLLTASLFVAVEPPREARRGAVRLLSSGRVLVGWRRQGGSRVPAPVLHPDGTTIEASADFSISRKKGRAPEGTLFTPEQFQRLSSAKGSICLGKVVDFSKLTDEAQSSTSLSPVQSPIIRREEVREEATVVEQEEVHATDPSLEQDILDDTTNQVLRDLRGKGVAQEDDISSSTPVDPEEAQAVLKFPLLFNLNSSNSNLRMWFHSQKTMQINQVWIQQQGQIKLNNNKTSRSKHLSTIWSILISL